MTNEKFENAIKRLNLKQKEAVEAIDGPIMVVAGPGSGKTEIISLRIANIIYKGLAKPDEILCLTFTDIASKNMLDRLTKIIGSVSYKVPIFTFHSFCTNLISRYPEYFFNAHKYEPIAELKQNEILESIFKKIRYGNPIFGFHEDLGYAYFNDVKSRIKNFKEAGLKPSEVKEKILQNKNDLKKLSFILEKVPENLRAKESKEKFKLLKNDFENSETEIGKYYAIYLEKEIINENLSEAKKKIFEKDEDGFLVFKDEKYLDKLLAVSDVYDEYQKELDKQGLFDFDDMIIYVKDELIRNNTLRSEVEETYQYILLDEFQDTNLAQLKLVESITNNPVLEGKANVFVVGDDDQSIYKFQGAELNNIFHFKNMYKDVKTIVLTENYRSTQKILNFAKEMIEKATERLTKIDKTLIKELISKNTSLKDGEIYLNSFSEKEQENLFVAKEIKKLIDNGINPKEIAVISRKHSDIQDILPYFDTENVPYNYERKESIFEQVHIEPLIKICKFLENIGENKKEEDSLLPEILSYEFFGIDRISIWEISQESYKSNKTWLEVMKDSKNEKIKELAIFFIELGILSKTISLEIILDILIGSRNINVVSEDSEDEYYNNSLPKLSSKFVSNYKNFYFGEDAVKENLSSYIYFLSSLRVFINELRNYKKGEKLFVKDLSTFIKLHKDYNVALLNKTSFVGDKNAINLMTVHKAKGLEFEYVFLIASNEKVWKSKGLQNKLPLPMNMPFTRSADNDDDFLRLFFVGLTRAKHTIYITHINEVLSFLVDTKIKSCDTKIENNDLKNGLKIYNIPPFAKNEKVLLDKILEDYKLSPTHLNNFLNIEKGGPKLFLEQNLLLFPQMKSSSSVYGSAIHKAVEELYVLSKKDKKVPSFNEIKEIFEKEIKKYRLLEDDEKDLINKGNDKLMNFYNLRYNSFLEEAKNSKTEINFKDEGVILDGAEFTGKIDRITMLDKDTLTVVDLKTGKVLNNLNLNKAKKDDYDNIKKYNYKHQLMFYKLLLENSRTYKNLNIQSGKLNFIDDINNSEIEINFDNDISKDEWTDFKKLIINVFKIIKDVDRLQKIDISKYEKNSNGILEFEKDIIQDNL